jgi:NTE family protein
LGDNIRYNLDYYIDNGFYWSYGFRSLFNGFNKNISNLADNGGLYDSDSDKINVDFSELTNQAYFQSLLSQKFLIGGGIEFKYLKIYSETLSSSNAVIDNSTYSGAFAYFKYDSFDNKYFPRKGWYLLGDIQTYLFSSNYTNFFTPFSIAKVDWGVATSLSKKIALKFQIDGGFSFGGESVPFFDFVLGGYGFNSTNNFKQFLGYDFMSLSGNSYLKSTVVLDYEFLSNNHFNFSANLANLGNNLFQSLDWLSWPQYSGYALGYGLETILGPVEVKYSWSPETSQGLAMFSVGFWF